MNITKEFLKKKRACAPGRKEFDRIFPKGMRLTRKNLIKAVRKSKKYNVYGHNELLLDIIWLVQKCFPIIYKNNEGMIYDLEDCIDDKKISERNVQYKVAKLLADELKLK